MKPALFFCLRVVALPSFPAGRFRGISHIIYCFLFIALLNNPLVAQDTLLQKGNPVQTPVLQPRSFDGPLYPYNKKRVKFIAAANVVGYGTIMTGLYATWYKDHPQSSFHTFNDMQEWKQMDKLGHVYSAYAGSKASMELWRWTGLPRKKRIWIGGMSGAVYQTVIETLDGFSRDWGWSWGDFGANVIGSGMFVAQELAWDQQRIQFKWSFHRKLYKDPTLNKRSDDVFGKGSPERFLKDYNGQTYWLSTTLKPFMPESHIPAWLQISVGTGVEGLFGARENIGKDKTGAIIFDRTEIKRYRQWYLAPDLDFTRIRTKKKGVKLVLMVLNVFKFPTPSLEYSNGNLKWNWLHF